MKSLFDLLYPNGRRDFAPWHPRVCDCCGKSVAEMIPSHVIRKTRPMVPPNSLCRKSLKIYDDFYGHCDTGEDYTKASEIMVKKLGEEKASQIAFEGYVAANNFTDSNECKDCDILDDDKYHEIRDARMSEEGSA